ncbi:chitin synthase chs-2-like [Mytilus edulis]|uniref:chitin synthase chs-2-like n=1 Tax=Mytilus edulis TaxID=6550 RepID=UPI0039EDF7C9
MATPISFILIYELSKKDSTVLFLLGSSKCKIELTHWSNENRNNDSSWKLFVGGLLSFGSFCLTTSYIWIQKKERLQSTDTLFIKPMYCGIFLDLSLLLNRRYREHDYEITTHSNEASKVKLPKSVDDTDYNPTDDWSSKRKVKTPMIYMCATMWHEERNEMIQLLKSIIRTDEDQSARRNVTDQFVDYDPDYYEMQAHVFFDDAFKYDVEKESYTVNEYVRTFIKCVRDATSIVYDKYVSISDPKQIETPYGAQLIWDLPGGNKLVAHLKDEKKIRKKKRWSQVMYMYYFLGYKLSLLKQDDEEKKIIAQNTFILALDGDVDFQPRAVHLLIDRMKKNLKVGAACGRIHPIGNGPMVWYQKFEYAISHWLQKAAENMVGCVLCSPGCFSLFRGSALMDENVMAKYTAVPTKAYQHVQYDQGEDRWLCTLLLKQGYKVEYVAASDALTFAPEGFDVFYNQRRRWSPSTMANIIDLIFDWKKVVTKNDDISIICVAYQTFLLITSLLTPGTILLMMLGAMYTAFPTIQPWTAFVVNLIPVAIMVFLCFSSKKQTQLAYAAIVSILYALVMMIVIVGLIKEAVVAQWCSVTTIFLLFVASAFVLSAMLHPQEIGCIFHGFIYFLAIPSMSMLLMIYALGNINDISWGTRDSCPVDGHSVNSKNSKQDGILSWFVSSKGTDNPFLIGTMFRKTYRCRSEEQVGKKELCKGEVKGTNGTLKLIGQK